MERNAEATNQTLEENRNLSEKQEETVEEPFDFLTEWNKIWEEA